MQVMIPCNNIKGVGKSKNFEKASQKYLQVMTTDDFKVLVHGILELQENFQISTTSCF